MSLTLESSNHFNMCVSSTITHITSTIHTATLNQIPSRCRNSIDSNLFKIQRQLFIVFLFQTTCYRRSIISASTNCWIPVSSWRLQQHKIMSVLSLLFLIINCLLPSFFCLVQISYHFVIYFNTIEQAFVVGTVVVLILFICWTWILKV